MKHIQSQLCNVRFAVMVVLAGSSIAAQASTARNDGWVGGYVQQGLRDYSQAIGRYVEPDPIGLEGGSFSTYTYVNDNPVAIVDPMGLDGFSFGQFGSRVAPGPGYQVTSGTNPDGSAFVTLNLGLGQSSRGGKYMPNIKQSGYIPNQGCQLGLGMGIYGSVSATLFGWYQKSLSWNGGATTCKSSCSLYSKPFGANDVMRGREGSAFVSGSVGFELTLFGDDPRIANVGQDLKDVHDAIDRFYNPPHVPHDFMEISKNGTMMEVGDVMDYPYLPGNLLLSGWLYLDSRLRF